MTATPSPTQGAWRSRLLNHIMAEADAIYDLGYQSVERCPICNRAVAAEDCEREPEMPPRMRMCFVGVDGSDSTCVEGLRA